MKITDPISDMLTRIRNANAANKAEVSMPSTKVLVEVARVICEEGYIAGYEVEDTTPQKTLHVTLKYGARHAKVIRGIRRISKPACASTPPRTSSRACSAASEPPSSQPPRA